MTHITIMVGQSIPRYPSDMREEKGIQFISNKWERGAPEVGIFINTFGIESHK